MDIETFLRTLNVAESPRHDRERRAFCAHRVADPKARRVQAVRKSFVVRQAVHKVQLVRRRGSLVLLMQMPVPKLQQQQYLQLLLLLLLLPLLPLLGDGDAVADFGSWLVYDVTGGMRTSSGQVTWQQMVRSDADPLLHSGERQARVVVLI